MIEDNRQSPSTPKDFWERCPVCRARLGESMECHRCRLDFSPMLRATDQARVLAGGVRLKIASGHGEEAFWEAFRAVRTHRTPQTLKSLALAAMVHKQFGLALAIWRQLKEEEPSPEGTGEETEKRG